MKRCGTSCKYWYLKKGVEPSNYINLRQCELMLSASNIERRLMNDGDNNVLDGWVWECTPCKFEGTFDMESP